MTKAIHKIQQSKKASVREARDNFSDLLGMVYYGNQTITIEKSGEPCAVLINPLAWKAYQEFLKEQAYATIKQLWEENKDFSVEEIENDIEDARNEIYRMRHGG